MRAIWEYISARAKYAWTEKKVMSIIMVGLGLFHIFLLAFFIYFSVYPMVALSVVAIFLYVFCFIMANKGKRLLFIFNLTYVELILYSGTAALLVGVDSGFTLYIIAMIPIGYYAAYNFNTEKRLVNPMLYVLFSTMTFLVERIVANYIEPPYSYGNKLVDKNMYILNFLMAMFVLVVFFSTLMNQIKYLEHMRMRQNRQLEELSKTDTLTGLANRRSIQERYARASLFGEEYALIMGDIDDFKKVNDTYGHSMGDEVLKVVAGVFRNAVRGQDTVSRWGGEEILIYLPACPLDRAKQRAQEIVENIRAIEFETEDLRKFRITMTLGVAVSTEGKNFEKVLAIADDRLYTGKRNGKNQVV